VSEPAALDLAAIRERAHFLMVTSDRQAQLREDVLDVADELEHCRAERDALRAAIDEIDHHTDGWTFGLASTMVKRIRLTARAALGEVTQ
jgi:hypothetical protein